MNEEKTFFWYDLETSGLSARKDRIMQFAGQRTTLDLEPIGKPENILVKLSDDTLPSPEALLVTGITPQKTLQEGIPEHEFCKKITTNIFTPNTIAVGYNSIRFDDEFIRHTLWRNFYDPYEWTWQDGRSRWDLLDVVRLTRALRPDGIKWPVDASGKANNKLEQLASLNNIEQKHAHDALSDVEALIGVAKMLKEKQPKLFKYLLILRDKNEINKLVNLDNPKPFVYASGRYVCPDKTTVAFPIHHGRTGGSCLVYDLRIDPTTIDFKNLNKDYPWWDLPIKEIQNNRCPAIAPLGVLNEESQNRLDLPLDKIHENIAKLEKNRGIVDQIIEIWNSRPEYPRSQDVEDQLYDGFISDADKFKIKSVRESTAEQLADFHPDFADERLPELLFRYKAREFPKSLSEDEHKKWQEFKSAKFKKELPNITKTIEELSRTINDPQKQFILDEIQLFLESNMPINE
ncbi:exodeoxyribonuclease I [Ruminococcaceae bacterium OttesenSCG-928-A11]|nr:exodeoxyribonuclease I [Ruminococcaceae bacterium OttesenSCG-928-A11]